MAEFVGLGDLDFDFAFLGTGARAARRSDSWIGWGERGARPGERLPRERRMGLARVVVRRRERER